jgi:hypothetical protein
MRLAAIANVAVLGALLAGCPDSETNAPTLWLALDGSEIQVKLVESEPPPF